MKNRFTDNIERCIQLEDELAKRCKMVESDFKDLKINMIKFYLPIIHELLKGPFLLSAFNGNFNKESYKEIKLLHAHLDSTILYHYIFYYKNELELDPKFKIIKEFNSVFKSFFSIVFDKERLPKRLVKFYKKKSFHQFYKKYTHIFPPSFQNLEIFE